MTLHIDHAELLGVSDSTLTLSFQVRDASDSVTEAAARVLVGDSVHILPPGEAPTRLVRIDGLSPATKYSIEIETEDGHRVAHDRPWHRSGKRADASDPAFSCEFELPPHISY